MESPSLRTFHVATHRIPSLQPPLVQAIFSRSAEEVQLLLHKKEDVNALVRMICLSDILILIESQSRVVNFRQPQC